MTFSKTTDGVVKLTLLENPGKHYSKIVSVFSDSIGFDSGEANQYTLLYSTYSVNHGETWSKPLLIDIKFNSGSGQTQSQIIDPDTLFPPMILKIRG